MDSTPLTVTYVYMRRNANCRIISCRCVQEYGTTLVHVRVQRKGEQKDLRYSRVHDGGLLLCCILGNFCVAKFLQKMQLKNVLGCHVDRKIAVAWQHFHNKARICKICKNFLVYSTQKK